MTTGTKAASGTHLPGKRPGGVQCTGSGGTGPGLEPWLHTAGCLGSNFRVCPAGAEHRSRELAWLTLILSLQSKPALQFQSCYQSYLPRKGIQLLGLLIHGLNYIFHYLYISLLIYNYLLINSHSFLQNHTFIHSFTDELLHLFIHLLVYCLFILFTHHQLTPSFTLSLTSSFTHSFHALARSVPHSPPHYSPAQHPTRKKSLHQGRVH